MTSTVPVVFQNCSNIFVFGRDEKYALCNITSTETPCQLLKKLHLVKDFRMYFFVIIPIVLSAIALILNITYLILQICVYIGTGSSYRKRYILLISRSLSTIMALLLFYGVIICWKTDGFLYSSAMIFIVVGCLNFLSITGTYIALSCLLYTAIVHPFIYKTDFTLRHCFIIVGAIWFVATAASVCVGLWGATLFYPDSAPVYCSFKGCKKPLAIIIVVSLSICYSMVIGVYLILLIRLRTRYSNNLRGSTKTNASDRQRSFFVAMNRLGMNMATFAVGSVPILIVCIVALSNLKSLSSLGEGDKSPCKTFIYSRLFVQVEILASVAAIVWLLAMILDPVINTMADYKLMETLKKGIKRVRKSIKSLRNGR